MQHEKFATALPFGDTTPPEVSTFIYSNDTVSDLDFEREILPLTGNSPDNPAPSAHDPAVLQFDLQVPEDCYLIAATAFGSDEYSRWLFGDWNDSFGFLIDGTNFFVFKEPGQPDTVFSIQDMVECGAPFFIENRRAPEPPIVGMSILPLVGTEYYDHEFSGFTKVLKREIFLPAGRYTLKIVIQDVADQRIDAALFIPEDGVTLFDPVEADFDMDGDVDGEDFLIWQANFPTPSGATKSTGDADMDGDVDGNDFLLWQSGFGESGLPDCRADFDRDGDVDGGDFLIWQSGFSLPKCASRYEGDADNDADVDGDDFLVWQDEFGAGPGGGGGSSSLLRESGTSLCSTGCASGTDEEESPTMNPVAPKFSVDLNGDDTLSDADVRLLSQCEGFSQQKLDRDRDGDFDVDDLEEVRLREKHFTPLEQALIQRIAEYAYQFGQSGLIPGLIP